MLNKGRKSIEWGPKRRNSEEGPRGTRRSRQRGVLYQWFGAYRGSWDVRHVRPL